MSKRKGGEKQGYSIQNEQGKSLSISLDVYNYINRLTKKLGSDEQNINVDMNKINKSLAMKPYEAETKEMYIAVKFNENGQIVTDYDPETQGIDMALEFKEGLKDLPEEVQSHCNTAILNFIGCVNQALERKTVEQKKKLETYKEDYLESAKADNVA
jgi:hypothetical protein